MCFLLWKWGIQLSGKPLPSIPDPGFYLQCRQGMTLGCVPWKLVSDLNTVLWPHRAFFPCAGWIQNHHHPKSLGEVSEAEERRGSSQPFADEALNLSLHSVLLMQGTIVSKTDFLWKFFFVCLFVLICFFNGASRRVSESMHLGILWLSEDYVTTLIPRRAWPCQKQIPIPPEAA